MDVPIIAALAAVALAGVSAAVAYVAFSASRRFADRLQQLAAVDEAAQRVDEMAAASIDGLEGRLREVESRLRAETERGNDLERRLRQAEQDLRAVGDAPLPPLPSGRSLAHLDDLRAALRAQAAEAADARTERRT
jgi:hypothetical protein